MKLTVVSNEPGQTCVETAGDVTVFDFTAGVNPLETLLGPEGFGKTVLLDLAKSTYIDSSGVGWLIQCHGRFRQAGGKLVVHSIAPMVNHCFRVLGIYDVLHIAPDEAAALSLAGVEKPTP